MKIKKKEYNKKIEESYWNGVEVGMKSALENPDFAKKYLENPKAIQAITKKIENILVNVFGNK